MERNEAARRARAAQALGGFGSAEALADAAKTHGNIGLKRIREIQQQRGDEPRAFELRTIAEACNLPYEFFTVDFADLPFLGERVEKIRERVEAEDDERKRERGALGPEIEARLKAHETEMFTRMRKMLDEFEAGAAAIKQTPPNGGSVDRPKTPTRRPAPKPKPATRRPRRSAGGSN